MANPFAYNYIITIHNKEDLVEQVMMCVLMCCRDNSHIYPVLDGCTDQTEEVIDQLINTFADIPITKVRTPDVHELLSINAGLEAANQQGDGFNIVLQDDVLLADFMLERKLAAIYEWAGPSLGYLSFRLGANFKADAAESNDASPLTDYIENAYGHGLPDADALLPGQFAFRHVPIKSPVCFPFSLVRSVGILEKRLAPYAHDDTEYAIRCMQAGYRNAVFAARFYSDLKWGGTRVVPHPEMREIQKRNMENIRRWHRSALAEIAQSGGPTEVFDVPGMVSKEEKERALKAWGRNRKLLDDFDSGTQRSSVIRVKSIIKKALRGIDL